MPILRIIEGQGAGFALLLGGSPVTIGRDPANALQIGDPQASRVHAELRRSGSGWQLRDLGSSNGTWCDQEQIQRMALEPGSTFRIGALRFRFEEQADDPAPPLDATLVGAVDQQAEVEGLSEENRLLASGSEADLLHLSRINRYLAILYEVIRRSGQATGREELFDLLDQVAAEALDEDTRCAVFLPTDEGWTLWPPHARRLRARFGSVPFSGTLLAASRARRQPLRCGERADLELSASMAQAGVTQAMAAPVLTGDEVQALLYVDRLGNDRPFAGLDLEFLAAVAHQLGAALARHRQVAELQAEVERLRTTPQPTVAPDIIGRDPALQAVRTFIARVASVEAPVLIWGESGTGKELVARAIHAASPRAASAPMQVVNCAALAESLVESTLFGHIKGAFTGATDTRPGLFELADGGTLFLDEVGELPAGVQAKLLRTLEQGEVQRLGDPVVRKVRVRLIAATNRALAEEVSRGTFRRDLYHRLDVLTIQLPPLRERPGDLDILIDHFLAQANARPGAEVRRLDPTTRALLLRHPWPGNIRQLRNAIDRACILAAGPVILPADLPPEVRGTDPPVFRTPIVSLAEVERLHILRILDHCGGNKKAAAELLGIDRSTLYVKLRNYGILAPQLPETRPWT